MPPARLARVGLSIVFLGLLASFFLFLDPSFAPESSTLVVPPPDSADLIPTPQNATAQQPIVTPWCQPDECASGRWMPREPPFTTIEQFQAAYANRLDRLWKGCHAIPSSTPRTPEELDKAGEDRLMKVMNWTWTPYTGKMRPWDADEFMIRLMRSPGGLILIGGTSPLSLPPAASDISDFQTRSPSSICMHWGTC